MVDVHCAPHRPIFINHLVMVRNPPNSVRSFPSRRQFVGALRRSRHREDETAFLVWIINVGRRWSGHLLVGQV